FYERVLGGDRRFVRLAGRHWLTDEIEIVPTPGLTPGDLSVVAHGARVSTQDHPVDLLIAGDALASPRAVAVGGDREVDLAIDVGQFQGTRPDLLGWVLHILP